MDRYWTYIEKQIQGPFEMQELLAVKGFCDTSQVCRVGEDVWQQAWQFPAVHSQLAPVTTKIAEIPTTPPRPTLYQAPNATRVSSSGDYISPDFQFKVLHQRPKLRFRKSTRQPLPRTYRVVPLPQPSTPHVSRGLPLLIALITLSSGLWAYGVHSGLPAPMAQWWHSHMAPPPVAPPLHQWRPAKRQPAPVPYIPVPVSHPKHSKIISHTPHAKQHSTIRTTRPIFRHASKKPWFDLRRKPSHRLP